MVRHSTLRDHDHVVRADPFPDAPKPFADEPLDTVAADCPRHLAGHRHPKAWNRVLATFPDQNQKIAARDALTALLRLEEIPPAQRPAAGPPTNHPEKEATPSTSPVPDGDGP